MTLAHTRPPGYNWHCYQTSLCTFGTQRYNHTLTPWRNSFGSTSEYTARAFLFEGEMSKSKMERRVAKTLYSNFRDNTIFQNVYPEWCKGSGSHRLELDFWIVDLDLAIEVQGRQHYEFIPYFHGDYAGFKAQQERDRLKRRRCEAYGVELIEVYDDLSLEAAIGRVRSKVNEDRWKPNKYRIARKHTRAIRAFLDSFQQIVERASSNRQLASMAGELRSQLKAYVARFGGDAINLANARDAQRLFALVKDVFNHVQSEKRERHKQKIQALYDAGLTSPMVDDVVLWLFRPRGHDGKVYRLNAKVVDIGVSKVVVKAELNGEEIVNSINRNRLIETDNPALVSMAGALVNLQGD